MLCFFEQMLSANFEKPILYTPQAILIQDFNRLQFVSGLKIVKNHFGEEDFLIMTNKYQRLATGTIDFNEFNFRILKANVNSVIRGTKCDRRSKHRNLFSWFNEELGNLTQIENEPKYDMLDDDEQSAYYE